MSKRLLLFWLLLLPLPAGGNAGDSDYFDLLHADRLRNVTFGDSPVRELIDSVVVRYGDLLINCDRARHDARRGELVCRGRVVVTHRNRVLHANEMTYYEQNRRLEAYGNVRMLEDSLRGECVRAIYYRDQEQLQMRQQAMLEDLEQDVLLTADRIDYDHETGVAWTHSQPLLRTRHPEHGNIRVVGRYMEMRRHEHLQFVAGDVEIDMKKTEATCDTFFFCDTSSLGTLRGEPLLYHENRAISGDLINMAVSGELLREVEVFGYGKAEVPADSIDVRLINSFSGDTLRFYFELGELQVMKAIGEANSVYFSRNEQDQPGLNLTAGDLIVLELDSLGISDIEVEGGARGRYLPLSLLEQPNLENEDGEPENE